MWIVRLALRRTYTFIVLAVLIAVLGAVGVNRMATDVFPEADVPVAVSSDTLTEQQIFDYTATFVIPRLGTVQGARIPQPYGGQVRQLMVDLDPDQLYARGLSANDVSAAIGNQNLIVPAGSAKI